MRPSFDSASLCAAAGRFFWPTLKTYPLEKKSLRVLSFVALIPLKTSKGDEFGACQIYGRGSQFNNSPLLPSIFSILLKCLSFYSFLVYLLFGSNDASSLD